MSELIVDEKSTSTRASRKRQLVYTLNANDVILGRGQHVKNEGNRQFVALVRSKVVEYHSSHEKFGKDVVARQIMHVIEALGGRFLRQAGAETNGGDIESIVDGGRNSDATIWERVDQAPVLVKIKQTFRDYSVRQRRAAAAACNGKETASTLTRSRDSHAAAHTPTIHHPSGVTLLQSYFQTESVRSNGENEPSAPHAPQLDVLPEMGVPELSWLVAQPMLTRLSTTAAPEASIPRPSESFPPDRIRRALDIWRHAEQMRQFQHHSETNTLPNSHFIRSVLATQPIAKVPAAAAAAAQPPFPPAEPLETDILRQAIDVWLCNEQSLERQKQSQQCLLHQILSLDTPRSEPWRCPMPPGRPLPPPPTFARPSHPAAPSSQRFD